MAAFQAADAGPTPAARMKLLLIFSRFLLGYRI